jgi:hypothetical protein
MPIACHKSFDADIRADTGISGRPGQGAAFVSENKLLPALRRMAAARDRGDCRFFVPVSEGVVQLY